MEQFQMISFNENILTHKNIVPFPMEEGGMFHQVHSIIIGFDEIYSEIV
jgi:hypothetical protein